MGSIGVMPRDLDVHAIGQPYAQVRETHTGVVILVGDRAYKAKRPVVTDFLTSARGTRANKRWPGNSSSTIGWPRTPTSALRIWTVRRPGSASRSW